MIIYTARIIKNDDRKLPHPIDVSIKSSLEYVGKFFAPTWDMVHQWKSGEYYDSWKDYEDEYYDLMSTRIINDHANILEKMTKAYKELTLLCYCQEHQHCHRNLAKIVFEKYCNYANIEYIDGGFLK